MRTPERNTSVPVVTAREKSLYTPLLQAIMSELTPQAPKWEQLVLARGVWLVSSASNGEQRPNMPRLSTRGHVHPHSLGEGGRVPHKGRNGGDRPSLLCLGLDGIQAILVDPQGSNLRLQSRSRNV